MAHSPSAVLASCERGDLAGLADALSSTAVSPAPVDHAWTLALRAVGFLHGAPAVAAPALTDVEPLAAIPAAREPAARGCAAMELVAALAFDTPALERWLALHEGLDAGDPRLAAGRLWRALLAGRPAEVERDGAALYASASRTGDAALVVQATTVRALAALAAGNGTATDVARRAARMAQAERLPLHEHVAHLVLARVRRHAGRPHLAAHILAALARVAPSPVRPWIAYELALAGSEDGARTLLAGATLAPARAAHAVLSLLAAARAGDRARHDGAAADLAAAVGGFRDAAAEAALLVSAIDADTPVADGLRDWALGDVAAAPAGLDGVAAADTPAAGATAIACVVAGPGRIARRVLLPGLGLLGEAPLLPHEGDGLGAARTEAALAVLALAGERGTSRDDFFARVYGFRFDAELHQGTLDVLVHRMRQRLGARGEIQRDRDALTVALAANAPFVITDARCTLPLGERVLRALARAAKATAQEIADALDVPLRTVQESLQQLVAEGACAAERAGRRYTYRVRDTTFTEITLVRPPA